MWLTQQDQSKLRIIVLKVTYHLFVEKEAKGTGKPRDSISY